MLQIMADITSEVNQFGGRIIDISSLPHNPDEFKNALEEALVEWRADSTKVVWIDLPTSLSRLVPVAVETGFVYHHAEASHLELTLTLKDGSYVPPYATHYIGAGGVVIDNEGMILVVVERYRGSWGRHYKLPGGALRPGEHISDGVVREVREETGIETRFESVACFRHWHGYRFGKSDIYFVCRLESLTHDIRRDPGEIEECLWMPLDEYLSHPDVRLFNREIVQAAVNSRGLSLVSIEGYGTPQTHEFLFPHDGGLR